jgi:glycosyltransferase involved in cell wall biosynthesis
MSQLSVIIPSRNVANLVPCIEAVRKHESDVRIIVIDDGLDLPIWRASPHAHSVDRIIGVSPFIFSRNVNCGIEEAHDLDCVILNDDALLESPNGFSAMQRAAQEHPEYGIISATTNLAGNPAQMRRPYVSGWELRECRNCPGNSVPVVAFVCVLITRKTIDTIGLLDERFTAYGWEDNDYCRRVNNAGLKIGIFDGCYVDHAKLTSTFRGMPTAAGDINVGRKIYLDKWASM